MIPTEQSISGPLGRSNTEAQRGINVQINIIADIYIFVLPRLRYATLKTAANKKHCIDAAGIKYAVPKDNKSVNDITARWSNISRLIKPYIMTKRTNAAVKRNDKQINISLIAKLPKNT